MARTRVIVIVLALIAAIGLGALVGNLAGGSKEPATAWTPPAATSVSTTEPLLQPTIIVPESSPVAASTPVAIASPESLATPVGG